MQPQGVAGKPNNSAQAHLVRLQKGIL